jgi:hypothetical protein
MGGRQKKKATGSKKKKAGGGGSAQRTAAAAGWAPSQQPEQEPQPEPEPESEPELESWAQESIPPAFKPGDAVIISGLQSARQHNYKKGIILNYVDETERYRVKLARSNPDFKPLGLRASNLSPLPTVGPIAGTVWEVIEDDEDGAIHYHNTATEETAWEKPEEVAAAEVAQAAAGGAELDAPTVGADTMGVDMSFEDTLLAMKEEDVEIERQRRHNFRSKKKAAIVAAQDKKEWEGVDESVVEFQRACEAHTVLWAKVDKLTPVRDEWHSKWEDCEAMALKELSLETKIEHAAGKSKKPTRYAPRAPTLHVPRATSQLSLDSVQSCVHRRQYDAKARVVRATEKRLKQLNKEITELIRQILELEEKYQINSKREVEAKMKEAVQTNDPELLEKVMKPSEEVHPHRRS